MLKQTINFILSIAATFLLAACSGAPAVDVITPLPPTVVAHISSTPQPTTEAHTSLNFDCQKIQEPSVEECRALVALYESTDGDQWLDRSGWLVDEKLCTWVGVMCYQEHVFELYLSHNGLVGPLPPEIGNLENLAHLQLSHNQLSGSIPAKIGDLHNLNWLDLSHNRLSGSIPAELENMPLLYWLDLSYNQLKGAVPAGLAKAPRDEFWLWGNLLDGTVPASEEPITTVEFHGVQFEFTSSLAESVWPEIGAALPPSEGGAWVNPEHIRFTFAGHTKPESFRFDWVGPAGHPQILIYPAQEFSTMSEIAKGEIEAMQRLLEARPPVPEGEIPLLPLYNNGQVFHAQVQYLDFQHGSGVRFITHYTQEVVGRLTKENVFYTFQGLTRDGKYYVAAFFPITSPGLRDEMVEEPWEVAQARLVEDIQYLDSLSSQAFTPELELLDSVIQSLVVNSH
jgi:Leucine rich repeat/Leucine Rich Repeat